MNVCKRDRTVGWWKGDGVKKTGEEGIYVWESIDTVTRGRNNWLLTHRLSTKWVAAVCCFAMSLKLLATLDMRVKSKNRKGSIVERCVFANCVSGRRRKTLKVINYVVRWSLCHMSCFCVFKRWMEVENGTFFMVHGFAIAILGY